MRLSAVTALLVFGAATAEAPPARAEPVRGSWGSLVNCLFTNYNPMTGDMRCEGSTLWRGTWTGITHYHVEGTYDVLTGDSAGTLRETFYGSDSTGRRGTLSFAERYKLDGAASRIHITAEITGGTGELRDARGVATFDGTNNVAAGYGTYSGEWTPPRDRGQ